MGGGGNRPLVKRRASLQRLCQVRLYRDIPGRLEMRCPDPGSQPLSSQACGGIRPVAFVHAAKSDWRKKRRRSQPSVAPVFGGGSVAVWWLQACATPPVLETKTDGLPSDTHSSTLSNDDMPPFAKIRPALVERHRSEHVMENIHGPQRPRRAKTSAPVDVAAAQTRRDASRAKGRCAAGGPVAACSRSSRRLRSGRSKRECGE
jgi:hypothetical protein